MHIQFSGSFSGQITLLSLEPLRFSWDISNPLRLELYRELWEKFKRGALLMIDKEYNFHFDKIISYVSKFYTLKIGDLIYTGTPEGVGKVQAGDSLKGYIGEKEILKLVVK